MTGFEKWETTLCFRGFRVVLRIGVVQVAHWAHGPKKIFRSMEKSVTRLEAPCDMIIEH